MLILIAYAQNPPLNVHAVYGVLSSTKHEIIMFINVKMPTNIRILTFIRMINAKTESYKARKIIIFQHPLKNCTLFIFCIFHGVVTSLKMLVELSLHTCTYIEHLSKH